MSEILLLKGRLSLLKEELKQLELKADNYIITIREKLDPYEDDLCALDITHALSAMNDLKKVWLEAKEKKEKILIIEKELAYV